MYVYIYIYIYMCHLAPMCTSDLGRQSVVLSVFCSISAGDAYAAAITT